MPRSDTDYVTAEGAANVKLALKAHRAVMQPTGTKTDPRQRSARRPALLETSIAQTQIWQHPGSLTDEYRQGFGAGLDYSLITASDTCHVLTIRLGALVPTGSRLRAWVHAGRYLCWEPRRQIPEVPSAAADSDFGQRQVVGSQSDVIARVQPPSRQGHASPGSCAPARHSDHFGYCRLIKFEFGQHRIQVREAVDQSKALTQVTPNAKTL
jgi:hypothetical protein